MDPLADVFEDIEPLPGGLARLQDRLDQRSRPWWLAPLVVGPVALAAVALLALRVPSPPEPLPFPLEAVYVGEVPTEAIQVRPGATSRVAVLPVVVTNDVVFARVGSVQ